MWLKRNDAKRFICMIITIVISVYPMSLSPVWNGKIPGHRDQYERMAQSILNGHLYLEYEDVDPRLSEMENPYDITIGIMHFIMGSTICILELFL